MQIYNSKDISDIFKLIEINNVSLLELMTIFVTDITHNFPFVKELTPTQIKIIKEGHLAPSKVTFNDDECSITCTSSLALQYEKNIKEQYITSKDVMVSTLYKKLYKDKERAYNNLKNGVYRDIKDLVLTIIYTTFHMAGLELMYTELQLNSLKEEAKGIDLEEVLMKVLNEHFNPQ